MGLIKAALGAAGGTLADQWKEFFYCDAIDNDVLAVKGQKRTSKRSSNTKGSDNIILLMTTTLKKLLKWDLITFSSKDGVFYEI